MHTSFTLHICMYDISLPLHTSLYRLPSMFQNSGFQAFSVAFRHLKFTFKFKVYTLYWGGGCLLSLDFIGKREPHGDHGHFR